MPKKEKNTTSWVDFIKYVFSFIVSKIREHRIRRNEKYRDAKGNLKKAYDDIDEAKNKKRDEDLKKRLDNMF